MKHLVLPVLFALGCAHAPVAPPPSNVADYYPLAVGNTWSYQIELLGAPPEKRDISITKEEQGRFTDSTGQVLSVDRYGIRDEKRYLLRTPLEVGTRWNNVVSVSSYEQYTIIETGHACDAPAGSFQDCVVVESRNQSDGQKTLVNTLTFAPKVGLVRVATVLEADGKRIPQAKLELVAYQVGQGAPSAAPPR